MLKVNLNEKIESTLKLNNTKLILLALLPSIFLMFFIFGWGTITNIIFSIIFLNLTNLLISILNKNKFKIKENKLTYVSIFILSLSLPPYLEWWILLIGLLFAVLISSKVFIFFGFDRFNSAMFSYAILLIFFPREMSIWPGPSSLSSLPNLGFVETIIYKINPDKFIYSDAMSMATPFDLIRQNNGLMFNDLIISYKQFGVWSGIGWEWINISFMIGGLLLLQRKVFSWHAPCSMILAITLCSMFFYDAGSSSSIGSPIFQLLGGGTMICAWFIVTDPSTSPNDNTGKFLYGFMVGVLIYLIRKYSIYPDGVAFAVLLINSIVPLINTFSQKKIQS